MAEFIRAYRQRTNAVQIAVAVVALAVLGVGLLFVEKAFAGAPTGTLTGTNQTVTIFTTSTISTLTFTDVSPSEVTASNDLLIKIPSTVNAIWDTSVTAPTIGGTGASSTNATVSYDATKKILTINATERFTPLATLTLDGLKMIGVNSSSTAVAIQFATDGSTYGNSSVSITVDPGTLTATNVEPGMLLSSATATSTITYTTATTTPKNGKIAVRYPSGFDVSGAANGACTGTGMDGTFSTGVSGQLVTITRANDGADAPPGTYTCTVRNIVNPAVGTAGTYMIYTQTSAGIAGIIMQDTAVTADTFGANALTLGSATYGTPYTGTLSTLAITFNTTTTIPATGKIKVDFPDGSSFNNGASVTCGTMDGAFALSSSGSSATITRSAGTAQTAATETCTFSNVTNPTNAGPTTFTVTTQNSSGGVLDTLSGIAGTALQSTGSTGDRTPPGPVTGVSLTSSSDGHSVTATWTNPTDADLAGVRVRRSVTSGIVGDLVTQTTAGTMTDSGLTAGTKYYYQFLPVDSSGNELVSAQEWSITTVAGGSSGTQGTTPTTPSTPTTPTSPTTPSTGGTGTTTVTFPSGVAAGDLVKGGITAVYWVGTDGKRYVFPNETVYRTWYADFSGVKTLSDATIAALPLGGTVAMRPGYLLVKIVSDPKVYAVEPGNVLRWIENETVAKTLYGAAWATRVRDVDVSLFVGYTIGASVPSAVFPAGSVVRDASGAVSAIEKVDGSVVRRSLDAAAISANRIFSDMILPADASVALPATGSAVTSAETAFTAPH